MAACVDEKYFARYVNVPKDLLQEQSQEPDEEVRAKDLKKQKLLLELDL